MSIGDIIAANLSRWVFANNGATDDDIRALTDGSSFPLPSGYLDLLRAVNGGEAGIPDGNGGDGSYLDLWEAADVVQFNRDYMLPRFAPSFFAFGSNGGGELFAFDSRRDDDAVFIVPAIGMSDDTSLPFADSVNAFARRIAVTQFTGHGTWCFRQAFGTPSSFCNARWPWCNVRSSEIVRFVQGGVVRTFRYVTYREQTAMVISAWNRSVSLDSPDGSLNATIDDAMEIGMGAPTRGDLVISTGLTIPDCGPSIVWADDSRYLAAPQWQPYDNGHRQRIVVISIERNAFRPVGKKFAVLELASFVDGIVCGIDCPATDKTPVEIDTQMIDW